MHVYENTEIWDARKSPHLYFGLPNLNSLINSLTRDNKSYRFQQLNKTKNLICLDGNAIFDQK